MPTVECPNCSQMLELESGSGAIATCPICGMKFDWRQKPPSNLPQTGPLTVVDAPWYLSTPDGQRFGPASAEEICGWIQEGRIPGGSMVWRKELGGWQPVETTPPFGSLFNASMMYPSTRGAGGGCPVIQQVTINQGSPYRRDRWSGMAIAGFVVSLACGYLAPLSLIFCAVALSAMKKDRNLHGKGLAIAGLVLSLVSLVFWVLLFAGVFAGMNRAAWGLRNPP